MEARCGSGRRATLEAQMEFYSQIRYNYRLTAVTVALESWTPLLEKWTPLLEKWAGKAVRHKPEKIIRYNQRPSALRSHEETLAFVFICRCRFFLPGALKGPSKARLQLTLIRLP